MVKLVAESLFELYGPGYVSDIASSNAKEKEDNLFPEDKKEIPVQHASQPSITPLMSQRLHTEEVEDMYDDIHTEFFKNFNEDDFSKEEDFNNKAGEAITKVAEKRGVDLSTGDVDKLLKYLEKDMFAANIPAYAKINVFEQPYASGEGKPHGYKTYAILKALEDSGGMRRYDMHKFLWQYSNGKNSLEREIFKGKNSSMRGHWGIAMSTGTVSNYITKKSTQGQKDKWVLSSEGYAKLKQLEAKFKDVE